MHWRRCSWWPPYTRSRVAAFIAAGLALALLAQHGTALLQRRHVYVIAALAALSLVPLLIVQARFATFNLISVVNRSDIDTPERLSWAGIGWYALLLPTMFGWPIMGLSAILVAGSTVWRQWRLPRWDTLLLQSWFLAAYVAFDP